VTQTGGDVTVIPTANPDQLGLVQSGGVDAVWTVEPWVTRLERDAKARVFLERQGQPLHVACFQCEVPA